MLYSLRCSPCMDSPKLSEFDQIMRVGLSRVLNLEFGDRVWLQATLPVKDGGLGIRSASSLALPAFLASAAGTASLQSLILSKCITPPDSILSSAVDRWLSHSGSVLPGPSTSHRQSSWDRPLVSRSLEALRALSSSIHLRATLGAVSLPHCGDWLLALPVGACGLRLHDEAVQIAAGLRHGANLCAPHRCPCGAMVTVEGNHGLSLFAVLLCILVFKVHG